MDRLCRLFYSTQTCKLGKTLSLLQNGHRCSTLRSWQRFNSSQVDKVPNDEPIPYTKSKAYKYKAYENFRIKEEDLTYPNYTSFVVKASVAIFLIYFAILREANDIDQNLGRDLFEILPDLEIPLMEAEVKKLENSGVDSGDLRQKLEELKLLKSKTEPGEAVEKTK